MSEKVRCWEDEFQEMRMEWNEIRQRKLASGMERCREEFERIHDAYRALVSRGLWVSGPADFLSIINRAEDERTHARMLAWLLTPTGRHGLGNSVLIRLLRHYDLKHGDADSAQKQFIVPETDCLYKVESSCWRNNREADIVVWGEDFTLVIEMKVNAGEPPTQCADLYTNFSAPGARFLFLTRHGDEPTTVTTKASRHAFETISWPQVRHIIQVVLKDPEPKRKGSVHIVENYLLTLKERFG